MAIFPILNFLHAAMVTKYVVKIQNGGSQQFFKKNLHYNYFVHTELESKVSFLNFNINSLTRRIFHLMERVQSQNTKPEDISVFDMCGKN